MRICPLLAFALLAACSSDPTDDPDGMPPPADALPALDRGADAEARDAGPETDGSRDQRVPSPDRGPVADLGVEPDLAPPPDDPCDGVADGAWCGGELPGSDHRSAYVCAGGRVSMVEPCAAGCEGGACRAPAADPCASAPGDGQWCGGTLSGGEAGALYRCAGGVTAEITRCGRGCRVAPPGTPDSCVRDDDPCAAAGAGDGAYCGRSLGAGDADALYICRGGQTVSASPCIDGCEGMPAGTPDACRAAGDPCARQASGCIAAAHWARATPIRSTTAPAAAPSAPAGVTPAVSRCRRARPTRAG